MVKKSLTPKASRGDYRRKEKAAPKQKTLPEMSHAEVNAAARNEGLTYGQYVAMRKDV